MNIVFRVDASIRIGTGHVLRCLTLARMLHDHHQGVQIFFVCRTEDGHLSDYIRVNGFQVLELESNTSLDALLDAKETFRKVAHLKKIDWVVVDHYQLDITWEKEIKKQVSRLLVIDDLANRPHDCDILLDQNYFTNYKTRYEGLVPNACKLFIGPQYLLLRPEFKAALRKGKQEKSQNRLLIFYGGSDPTNETEKVLEALESIQPYDLIIDVVVGTANPKRHHIEKLANERGANYYCQIDYLAELMTKASFSLGAGGVTMWERCFLGLPSYVTIVAENQLQSTEAASQYGAVYNVGWHEEINSDTYKRIIKKALSNDRSHAVMREKSFELMNSNENQEKHPVISQMIDS
ncbi:MAG: UDP-2,4-diacetamido-2,4,6-trideoxy-beta-L-altropyranose hydrolase [Bacillaceae bacterium]|nr:UDP-2,4-diacetamido-2,4,6-trideoxy-beta-L-altropyranose hydrolase [Bacillaceae bacterium]